MNSEAAAALWRARLPSGIINERLAQYPAMKKIAAKLTSDSKTDAQEIIERIGAGKGWIIEGAPMLARQASLCLLKGLLLSGFDVFHIDGMHPSMASEYDDDRQELSRAQVVGISRYYDNSYKTYPRSAQDRHDAEAAMMDALERKCTPVIHCCGMFAQCDWYSTELADMLSKRCEKITVTK